jgi:serine/threonine protein kinase/peptidoglycan hydrolase-like protein with peptidoglycan-binding domain
MTPLNEMGPGPRDDQIALRPGQTVGRYRIEALLRSGAVGMTYRARDIRLGREVTIKEFLPSALALRDASGFVMPSSNKTADEFGRGRRHFLNEGRMLASLQLAPSVVRVLDVIEANETAYIIMESVQGITLEDKLREGNRLSSADLDRMLWPLLESLERVHTRGFFHGDINPANIVLDAVGKPTLIDFGAARTPATAAATPCYAAPEQMSGGKQGAWTDIYGLAATLYHALVGHPPPNVRDRLPEDTCHPLVELKPAGFTPAMLEGIDKGLVLRTADRPQSIAQWRSILWRTGKYSGSSIPIQPEAALDAMDAMMLRAPKLRPTNEVVERNVSRDKPAGRRVGWLGFATASALALGGLTYFVFAIPSSIPTEATAPAGPTQAELDRQRLRLERETQEKAAQQAALVKRQQEEAERQRLEAEKAALRKEIEAEILKKQEAAAEAKRKAEAAADPKIAQAAEAALRLTQLERQQLQVALSGLGFDTRGADGVFGPRTRQVIAAWQKGRNEAATGFLTAPQKAALFKDGAAAIAAFDDQQKKAAEAAKVNNPYDGSYVGIASVSSGDQPVSVRVVGGKGSGRWKVDGCGTASFTLSITPDGAVGLDLRSFSPQCEPLGQHLDGQVASNTILISFSTGGDSSDSLTVTRQE